MGYSATHVQVTEAELRARVLRAVTNPRGPVLPDEVMRVILDVARADLDFIEQYAMFRNATAKEQKKKLKRHWSRKSMAEQFISDQTSVLRDQLAKMFLEVGPFPEMDPDDPAGNRLAMAKYAKRVVAWTEAAQQPQSKKQHS